MQNTKVVMVVGGNGNGNQLGLYGEEVWLLEWGEEI